MTTPRSMILRPLHFTVTCDCGMRVTYLGEPYSVPTLCREAGDHTVTVNVRPAVDAEIAATAVVIETITAEITPLSPPPETP